jgi:hypothetical protein
LEEEKQTNVRMRLANDEMLAELRQFKARAEMKKVHAMVQGLGLGFASVRSSLGRHLQDAQMPQSTIIHSVHHLLEAKNKCKKYVNETQQPNSRCANWLLSSYKSKNTKPPCQ